MKITLFTSGGIIGKRMPVVDIDLKDLRPKQSTDLYHRAEQSGIFDSPKLKEDDQQTRDSTVYHLTVEDVDRQGEIKGTHMLLPETILEFALYLQKNAARFKTSQPAR